MNPGKNICNELKAIRKQIATENDIPLEIEECSYKGQCNGTCPRCESEVRYLEQALAERMQLGKIATIAGLALGLSSIDNASAQVVVPDSPTDSTIQRPVQLEGDVTATSIFIDPEIPAVFPGGEEALYRFIEENLQYPTLAAESGIGGTVFVSFVVDTLGMITDPRIVRDIGGGCGREALRIVQLMPRWEPARWYGHAISTQYMLPIFFDISKNRVPLLEGIVPIPVDDTSAIIKPAMPPDDCKNLKEEPILQGDVRPRKGVTLPKGPSAPTSESNLWISFIEENGTSERLPVPADKPKSYEEKK